MITKEQINNLINECRTIAAQGLRRRKRKTDALELVIARIPELTLDVLEPPNDFVGVDDNPAIFINKNTFKFLGRFHPNWKENCTIATKSSFLNQKAMDVVGIIIHETGHAFNVAAGIENNEANAYLFEIEVILQLLRTNRLASYQCSFEDVRSYFHFRLSSYHKETEHNLDLKQAVEQIQLLRPPPAIRGEPLAVAAEPITTLSRHRFFTSEVVRREEALNQGQLKSSL